MLGAGQEVGRSCCVLTYKGKTVVCDAGVHPAYTGLSALPFVDELDWSTVDALLITHFHLDHAAALTYIMEKTNFKDGKGKVYMTHPTKAVYRFLMSDFVRISNAGSDDQLFDEGEMLASWRQIEAVDYHQEVNISGGLRFTPYHAGHVLGACMFFIEIAGLRILYTGDYSREEDRHLVQAEVPPVKPDVLICESTYGTQSLGPRLEKEARFTNTVHQVIKRGGRALLPVFVLGRAQELLLLLDEYWSKHPELHNVPIYYASSLAQRCIRIYQTYIHTMNDNIRSRFNRRDNPFVFKHISNLKSLDKFEDKGPCVMMASPGLMHSGVSRELLERWAPDRKNAVIITGYSVEGTLARTILNEPEEIVSMSGQKIPRRCTVDYQSFSAHVDYAQNSKFIDEVKASHVVLVHGEANTMSKLRAALQKRFKDRKEDIKVHTPRNCEPLHLTFRGDRTAKVIGSLAKQPPAPDSTLTGLLVSKDFAYTVLDPSDLADFTGLSMSTIIQRQRLALHVSWPLVLWHLTGMFGKIAEGVDLEDHPTARVMDAVDVKRTGKYEVTMEWVSSIPSDMVADATGALLLGISSSRASIKMTTKPHAHVHADGHDDETRAAGAKAEVDEVMGEYDDGEAAPAAPHPYSEAAAEARRSESNLKSLDAESPTEARATSASNGGNINMDFVTAATILARTETIVALLEAQIGPVEEMMVGELKRAKAEPEDACPAAFTSLDGGGTAGFPRAIATGSLNGNGTPGPDPDVRDNSEDGAAPPAQDDEEGRYMEPRAAALEPIQAIRGPPRHALLIWLDEACAAVEVESLMVTSASRALKGRVERCIKMALQATMPLADAFSLEAPLQTNIFALPPSQVKQG
ncbi:Endoribonuclease YSH1 [Tilletiaria anomala UBC 951]|uniref:Endoribonuclease YSH1 n=1 Tax=Tilletiaria anomala (strain ATCC 24038 / CBS 436.72 / UBC 951) TaxID=1037660 RepID=A0A066WNL4_TILAU|nr:Endoribonuclease YSH1 [Tilletiaria anomala UBC 951]KDN52594.1 Endoribonuclease YSH1 [Tilletiaria anomala UBC 951]